MKLNVLAMTAAALGLCLGACSNDGDSLDGGTSPVIEGQPASLSISISEPPSTRAADPDNATAEETAFYTADVFIYADGQLVKHQPLAKSAFSNAGDHMWATTDPIVTTTGEKEIYVGLNMPEKLAEDMAAIKNKTGLYLLANVDNYPLDSQTEGFVMFSTDTKKVTMLPDVVNNVTIPVGRIVAKVTVQKGANLSPAVAGGTIEGLDFAIRNSNKVYWPFQKRSGGVVLDPNYYVEEYDAAQFAQSSEYVAVDDAGTLVEDRNVKYTPENTSDKIYKRESTYASVRAGFIPSEFTLDDGTQEPNTSGSVSTFWTVRLDETGEVYYFDSEAGATAFASAKDVVSKYDNGYCYYNLFLNPTENYQTYRNYFYQLRITSITGLGKPNPDDGGKEPEPIDQDTNFTFVVDIEPWTLRTDNYDLH